VSSAKRQCRLPIYLGSGVTPDNLGRFFGVADGFIVGTYLKRDGDWAETVDPVRVERLMAAHAAAASRHA
jgi:predicted TIM-barrel enzyme